MSKKPTKKVIKKDVYHHGDLRNVLIETAKTILIEEGQERLTLRHCAQKAGVAPSSLSHHFKNLEGLLTSVAASGFDDLAFEMKKNLKELKDKEDPVKNIFRTYINFALKNSDLYRAMFSPKVGLGAIDYLESNQSSFLILYEEAAKQKRKLGKLPPQIAAFRLWALVHGFLLVALTERIQMLLPEKHVKNKKLVDIYFDYLIKGLW